MSSCETNSVYFKLMFTNEVLKSNLSHIFGKDCQRSWKTKWKQNCKIGKDYQRPSKTETLRVAQIQNSSVPVTLGRLSGKTKETTLTDPERPSTIHKDSQIPSRSIWKPGFSHFQTCNISCNINAICAQFIEISCLTSFGWLRIALNVFFTKLHSSDVLQVWLILYRLAI